MEKYLVLHLNEKDKFYGGKRKLATIDIPFRRYAIVPCVGDKIECDFADGNFREVVDRYLVDEEIHLYLSSH